MGEVLWAGGGKSYNLLAQHAPPYTLRASYLRHLQVWAGDVWRGAGGGVEGAGGLQVGMCARTKGSPTLV